MNNIQAKDWAEEDWGCYSGMASNPYEDDDPPPKAEKTEPGAGQADGE
ncbi:hypothetical protein R80B4_01310 [Fibrobacteres bacterium R8-0-B4]